jgi:hypothetical protein
VRRVLFSYKCHPAVDVDGRFRSHLFRVPRRFLDAHPLLWKCPHGFAHLLRTWPDADDVPFLAEFGGLVADDAVTFGSASRCPQRTVRSAVGRLVNVVGWIRRSHPPGDTVRGLLRTDQRADDLVRLVTGCASVRRRPRRRHASRRTTTLSGSTAPAGSSIPRITYWSGPWPS